MTRTLRLPIAVLAASFGAAAFAQAQVAPMVCAERDPLIASLAEEYGEMRRGGGLVGPTAIIEIWVSEETGTWTITHTTTTGWTCIVATGDTWQDDTGTMKRVAGEPV